MRVGSLTAVVLGAFGPVGDKALIHAPFSLPLPFMKRVIPLLPHALTRPPLSCRYCVLLTRNVSKELVLSERVTRKERASERRWQEHIFANNLCRNFRIWSMNIMIFLFVYAQGINSQLAKFYFAFDQLLFCLGINPTTSNMPVLSFILY